MSKQKTKRRWFFPVITLEDANEAIKIAYQTALVVAALQFAVQAVFLLLGSKFSGDILDPILAAVLGLVLRNRPSRLAAVTLLAYAILIAGITAMARFGRPISDSSGNNIVVAAIFVFGAYKGVQGTFGYHRIVESRVVAKSVFKILGAIIGYVVMWNILFFASLSVSSIATLVGALEESWQGLLWMFPIIALIFLGSLGLLPGTRTLAVTTVHRDSESTNDLQTKP